MLSDIVGKSRVERDIAPKDGDSLRSAIKQVASGRFGVTAEYLVNADQLQIKMAQGAKPGEGGQLPGHKVSEYIGFLRHSVPGVGLISPPPHHDIYSIEDLAQLIHDLKNANSRAPISVKLVSEVGSAPSPPEYPRPRPTTSSLPASTAGREPRRSRPSNMPAPRGIGFGRDAADSGAQPPAEPHPGPGGRPDEDRTRRRDRRPLGADEFGFATAPLVVEGCIMMRKCHLNTCPVGSPPRIQSLRRRFTGQPEHVVNYFFFVAEEVRGDHGPTRDSHFQRTHRSLGSARHARRSRALEGQGASISARFSPAAGSGQRAATSGRRAGPWPCQSPDHALIEQARPAPEKRPEGPDRSADHQRQSHLRHHAFG